jgi:uncharacterized spore protein YtfJ
VRLLPVSQSSAVDKIIDMAPDVIENIIKKFSGAKKEKFDVSTEIAEEDFVIG